MISFDFENVLKKSFTFFLLGHCMETVLRDPLSYATFSLRSLEGSHMTISTVILSVSIAYFSLMQNTHMDGAFSEVLIGFNRF